MSETPQHHEPTPFERLQSTHPEQRPELNALTELSDPGEIRKFLDEFINQPVPRGQYDKSESWEKEQKRDKENRLIAVLNIKDALRDPLFAKNKDVWEPILDEYEKRERE